MGEPDRQSGSERAPSLKNVGGTQGGLFEFLLGVGLLCAGGYLFLDQVLVTSSVWTGFFGQQGFGLAFIPIFLGIVLLFFKGRSLLGWLLLGGGGVIVFVGVLARMNIWFRPTSLFHTLLMLGMMAAGIGLVARAVRPH